MTLDEAMRWLASHGGKVHVVRRTADRDFFQVVVAPHHSDIIGVQHHGGMNVRTDDPEFHRAFIQMVESVRQKVGA